MPNRAIELIQDRRGKLSKTALMFLIWMTFLMICIGYVTYSEKKLAELPESYVYLTVILCGTYTARRFLDDKFGRTNSVVVGPPTIPVTAPTPEPPLTTLPPVGTTTVNPPSTIVATPLGPPTVIITT